MLNRAGPVNQNPGRRKRKKKAGLPLADETPSEKPAKAEINGEESEKSETNFDEPLVDESASQEPEKADSNGEEPLADETTSIEPVVAETNGADLVETSGTPPETEITTEEPLVAKAVSQESEETSGEPEETEINGDVLVQADATSNEPLVSEIAGDGPEETKAADDAPKETSEKSEEAEINSGEPLEADLTAALSREISQEPEQASAASSDQEKPAVQKVGFWRRLASLRWVLLAWFVRLVLTGACLGVCYLVLNSTPHKDIYIQWTTTPLTVGVSASLVLMVALRELLGQFRNKLAWQVRSWLNFLIPLMLLIFVSILLNKFNLVTSVG